jgi:glutaredoxin 3
MAGPDRPPTQAAPSPLGTKDPIAGPLVAAARSIGALPKAEEDGWTGEPSEWAEADSFTQKLSSFTQSYLSGFKQFVAEQVAGDFDVDAVDQTIEQEVSRGGVLMYSFTSCPFCKKAKELLDEKGASYTVVELDELADGAARRARLGARTGRTSVPAVFISGDYIGGLNDGSPGLAPLDAAGELVPRLRGARALSLFR